MRKSKTLLCNFKRAKNKNQTEKIIDISLGKK